jgi:hypothetical protein
MLFPVTGVSLKVGNSQGDRVLFDNDPIIRYRSETPILVADRPWEEGASLRAISVVPEEGGKRQRLYYLTWHRGAFEKNALCVAYTENGTDWEKPDLGEGNNIVMRGSGRALDWGAFFPQQVIHEPDCDDENLHWKMVYWDRPTQAAIPGLCLAASRDGFTWRPLHDHPIVTNQNDGACLITANEHNPILWMDCKYYLYQQTWKYNPTLPVDRDNMTKMHRRISIWAANGFGRRWVGPISVLEPDEDDPPAHQFYWLTVFHTNKGYGGYLQIHDTVEQTEALQLVTSEDGWQWQRQNDRRPILTPGGPGRFDSGMVFATCGPMVIGDKAFILYGGQSWLHDQQLRYPDAEMTGPDAGIGIAEVDPARLNLS